MVKALLASIGFATVLSALSSSVAQADHRWRFDRVLPLEFGPGPYEREVYLNDDFEDDIDRDLRNDEDEPEIIIPRRKRGDYVYDPETDEFILKPGVARGKKLAAPVKSKRKLTDDDKRRIAVITGKPEQPAKKSVSRPLEKATVAPAKKPETTAKPLVAKPAPAVIAPLKPEPKVAVATPAEKPVTTSKPAARLVLDTPKIVVEKEPQAKTASIPAKQPAPKVASVPPKSSVSRPLTPADGAISCDKAVNIVTGYGFQSVAPQMCVGKTYSFRALRDGKMFEIRMSSASGELTEVRKL